jgi:hypothetical protein
MHDLVAFACARLEPFAVEYHDMAAPVPDQALCLHPLRQQRHRCPPGTQHLCQKFLSQEHLVAAENPVVSNVSSVSPAAIGNRTRRASFEPATTKCLPSPNFDQFAVPRHIRRPLQRGMPSSGNRIRRSWEWMPSRGGN